MLADKVLSGADPISAGSAQAKIYLVSYRLRRTITEIWDDMEFVLLADTIRIAAQRAESFLEDTRTGRSWIIVRIVEAID